MLRAGRGLLPIFIKMLTDMWHSRTIWGLVAGPNNRVYLIDQAKSKLYGWDILNGLVWQQNVGKKMTNPCLDVYGQVHAIHPDGVPWVVSSIPGGPGEDLTM